MDEEFLGEISYGGLTFIPYISANELKEITSRVAV
jgi:hypothetical protein